jgi:hypothetical protein
MGKKVFCSILGRDIDEDKCCYEKRDPHCQECLAQKPIKPPPKYSYDRKGQRARKKKDFLSIDESSPIFVAHPIEDEFSAEEYPTQEELNQFLPYIRFDKDEYTFDLLRKFSAFKKSSSPVDLIQTFLAAHKSGLYPPLRVLNYIAEVFEEYMRFFGEKNLDNLFFRVAKGQEHPIKTFYKRQRNELLMRDVFRLELLGFAIPEASSMVAGRLKNTPEWDQTGLRLTPLKKEAIRDLYYQGWKETLSTVYSDLDAELLMLKGEDFLTQFPKEVFPPKKKNINKIITAFRNRHPNVRDRLLAEQIFRLELLGFTEDQAVRMVIARFNSLPGFSLREADIGEKYLKEWKERKHSSDETLTLEILKEFGEKILEQYPKDSFPPKKGDIEQIMKAFRELHGGVK